MSGLRHNKLWENREQWKLSQVDSRPQRKSEERLHIEYKKREQMECISSLINQRKDYEKDINKSIGKGSIPNNLWNKYVELLEGIDYSTKQVLKTIEKEGPLTKDRLRTHEAKLQKEAQTFKQFRDDLRDHIQKTGGIQGKEKGVPREIPTSAFNNPNQFIEKANLSIKEAESSIEEAKQVILGHQQIIIKNEQNILEYQQTITKHKRDIRVTQLLHKHFHGLSNDSPIRKQLIDYFNQSTHERQEILENLKKYIEDFKTIFNDLRANIGTTGNPAKCLLVECHNALSCWNRKKASEGDPYAQKWPSRDELGKALDDHLKNLESSRKSIIEHIQTIANHPEYIMHSKNTSLHSLMGLENESSPLYQLRDIFLSLENQLKNFKARFFSSGPTDDTWETHLEEARIQQDRFNEELKKQGGSMTAANEAAKIYPQHKTIIGYASRLRQAITGDLSNQKEHPSFNKKLELLQNNLIEQLSNTLKGDYPIE